MELKTAMASNPAELKGYAKLIAEILPDSNPRYIEAWMRLEYPTLNGLSPEKFRKEVLFAARCIASVSESESESIAKSFGL